MKTLILALALLAPFASFCQLSHITTTPGETFQYPKDKYKWTQYINSQNEMVGIRDIYTGFYIGRYAQSTRSYISQWDYSDFVLKEKTMGSNTVAPPKFYQVGDHLYLLYFTKKKKEYDLYAREVNFKTQMLNPEVKHLVHITDDIEHMRFVVSPDQKRLIFSYLYSKDLRKSARMGYHAWDASLNEEVSVADRQAPFPAFDYYDAVECFVDSRSDVYITWFKKKNTDGTPYLYILRKGATTFDKVPLRGHAEEQPYFLFDEKADGVYLSDYGCRGGIFAQTSSHVGLYKLDPEQKKAETLVDAPIINDSIYEQEEHKFLKNEFGGVVKSGVYFYKPQQVITLKDNSKFIIGYAQTGEYFDAGFTASYIDASGKYQWTKHIFSYYWTNDRQRDFLVDEEHKVLYVMRSYKGEFEKTSVSKQIYPDIRITALDATGKVTDKVILDQASGISNILKVNNRELAVEVLLYSTDDGANVVAQPIKVTLH